MMGWVGCIEVVPYVFICIEKRRTGKMSWSGSVAPPMIGECRRVLRTLPCRHWVSSPPLKAAAAASADASCAEPALHSERLPVV